MRKLGAYVIAMAIPLDEVYQLNFVIMLIRSELLNFSYADG